MSTTENKAKELLEHVKFIYVNLPDELKVTLRLDSATQFAFEEPHGSQIVSLTASPKSGRGASASRVLMDEAAFIEDAEEVWKALLPTISTGGSIVVQSTPNGVGNMFHRLWTGAAAPVDENGEKITAPGENGFYQMTIPWTSHPDRDEEWGRETKMSMSPSDFAQEHDCDFLQSGRPVFAKEFVEACHQEQTHRQPQAGRRYACGVDVSLGLAKGDYSAFKIFDVTTRQEVYSFRGKVPPDVLAKMLYDKCSEYNEAKIAVESNNHGLTVINHLVNMGYRNFFYMKRFTEGREIRTKRIGWYTTQNSKKFMIDELESALRNQTISFSCVDTKQELISYQYDDNGTTNAPDGYHDDCVMALAITIQCMREISPPRLVTNRSQAEDRRRRQEARVVRSPSMGY